MGDGLKVDHILKDSGFSQQAIDEVKAGKLHNGGNLQASSDKELSVKLAFQIQAAKIENVKVLFLNSPAKKEYDPTVESLGMIAASGGEGSLEDFTNLKLTNATVMDKLYKKSAPGSDLNLAKSEIAKFKGLKTHDEIEKCLHQILLERYRAYKKNGLAGIPNYARSKKEFSVADELKRMVEASTLLKKYAPGFQKLLLEYPDAAPEGMEESFFWVNSIIDDKPTIALVHRMGVPEGDGYVYMERHFYISRSHNCLQGVGAAVPSDDGIVVMYATRTSTDQVSGFGGSAKRTIGNKLMGGRMAENFARAAKVAAANAQARELDMMKM